MNTDITASTKPEYPVVDRNPPFTKTVANFNTLDYLRLTTISGVAITVGYLSGTPFLVSTYMSNYISNSIVFKINFVSLSMLIVLIYVIFSLEIIGFYSAKKKIYRIFLL